MPNKHVRLTVWLSEETIAQVEAEANRRNATKTDTPWTWRDLAQVRCAIMLEEWARDCEARAREAQP